MFLNEDETYESDELESDELNHVNGKRKKTTIVHMDKKMKKNKTYIEYDEKINEKCETSLSDVFFIIKNNISTLKDFELAELTLMIIACPNILYDDIFDWDKMYENLYKNDWNFKIQHILKKFYYQCRALSCLLEKNRSKKNITNNNVFVSSVSKDEFEKIQHYYKDYRPLYKKQTNKLIF